MIGHLVNTWYESQKIGYAEKMEMAYAWTFDSIMKNYSWSIKYTKTTNKGKKYFAASQVIDEDSLEIYNIFTSY